MHKLCNKVPNTGWQGKPAESLAEWLCQEISEKCFKIRFFGHENKIDLYQKDGKRNVEKLNKWNILSRVCHTFFLFNKHNSEVWTTNNQLKESAVKNWMLQGRNSEFGDIWAHWLPRTFIQEWKVTVIFIIISNNFLQIPLNPWKWRYFS